jgi:kumamolisin
MILYLDVVCRKVERFMPFNGPSQQRGHRQPRTIYPFLVIPLLAVVLIGGSLALYLRDFVHAAPADPYVSLSGSVPSVVAQSRLVGPTNPNQTLSLSVSLHLRNQAALNSYVSDVTRPKSANFHRYLTQAQFIAAFSPTLATQNAIIQYLQSSGFTVTQTYNHRLLIDFSGSVGQAETTFQIHINNYTAPNGTAFFSNATDPVLPSSIQASVAGIIGLNNFGKLHPMSLLAPVATQHSKAAVKAGQPATSCQPSVDQNSYYTFGKIQSAYDLNGFYSHGYNGEGQTVALFELAQYQSSDITHYEQCYGNSTSHIYTISVDGGAPSPGNNDYGGAIEANLDIELVLSAAPKIGQIRVYEAPNSSQASLDEWSKIVSDDPAVVSTSWGECEYDTGSTVMNAENAFFQMAVAQGESIFAAAADNGSAACYPGNNSQTFLNADDPASQPDVTGVGGTSMTLSGTSYGSETVWNNQIQNSSNPVGGAGGGGISQQWSMPSWQSAPGVNNGYTSGTPCGAPSGTYCREVPDVSLHADPEKGYLEYCTVSGDGCANNSGDPTYPWLIVGGTSCGAPIWAAIAALTNEESVKNGGFNLGFINPLLYQIASGNNYGNDFHDVTTGENDWNDFNNGKYPATTAYDLATGLGSPDAYKLAQDLIALNGQRTASPASTTWYFAEGSAGAGFQEFLTVQNPSTQSSASVTFKYLIQGSQNPIQKTIQVPASTRETENVNTDVNAPVTGTIHLSLATIVTSTVPVVVERPMYFNSHTVVGIASGSDVLGATNPSTDYYFSEASSATGYSTFLTMMNPSSSLTDTVTITYYTGSCDGTNQPACPTETKTLTPLQRQTIQPTDENLHEKLSIWVHSNNDVVVERPMYFKANIPNVGNTTGAASEVGATSPGTNWLFAEGYTGQLSTEHFQTYYELANFGASSASVTVKLEYTNGDVQAVPVTVPAYGFTQFDVNNANAHPNNAYCTPSPCQVTTSVSAQVTSNNPIVADRLMYFNYNGYPGSTDVVGTPAAQSIYAFAEGYTEGTFTEFLTLQNPNNSAETVAVTLFTASSLVLQQRVTVSAYSRSTLNINNLLNPVQPNSVSLVVQVMGSGTIVAERPLYFDWEGDPGGTDVIGFPPQV